MTSKSEFKVGDLVRRVNPSPAEIVYSVGPDGDASAIVGIVIATERQLHPDDTEVCVKWLRAIRGKGYFYPHQLKGVIKE